MAMDMSLNRVLDLLNSKKDRWVELSKDDHCQDLTHENFISNTIWVIDSIIKDIEKMTCHDLSQESL